MKLTKTLCAVLALCMVLGCAGIASAEPPEEKDKSAMGGMMAGGSAAVRVSGDTLSLADSDGTWFLEGQEPDAPDAIGGFLYTARSISDRFLSVSAAEHAEPLTDGYTAVVGDGIERYDAPNFAELYTANGLDPNAEGYNLDYTWIGGIDWDPASDSYGQLSAVTGIGQEILERVMDGAYSTGIIGGSSAGETAMRGPTQISNSGGAAMLVQNTYIYSEGLEGLAISNSGTAGVGSTLVVRDSLFVTRGYVNACADQSENLPNDPLLVTGADRTNLSGGESRTFYYDSAVVTDGWASLSTDGASGAGVDLIAAGTYAGALLGGYGTYADSNCRDYFYGSALEGAEIGVIIAETGSVSVFDGDEGLPGGRGCAVGLNGDIDPYAYAQDPGACGKLGGSVIAGGRNAVMIHVAGTAAVEAQGVFTATDSALVTDPALLSDADTLYSVNASWYGRELSPNIQKYIEYVQGDLILLKSTNARVTLDGVTMDSSNGVLIHSVLNNDTSTPETPASSGAAGSAVTMANMDVTGDILDEDYERPMAITLDNTALSGRIVSGSCKTWTDKWLDAGYAEDYTVGLASNTFGEKAPLDAFVHALTFSGDGSYTYTEYGGDQSTSLTLQNGAVWNVTGESSLTALTVGQGCTVNGAVTVNGVVTALVPGAYEGVIIVTPAPESDLSLVTVDGETYVRLEDVLSALGG